MRRSLLVSSVRLEVVQKALLLLVYSPKTRHRATTDVRGAWSPSRALAPVVADCPIGEIAHTRHTAQLWPLPPSPRSCPPCISTRSCMLYPCMWDIESWSTWPLRPARAGARSARHSLPKCKWYTIPQLSLACSLVGPHAAPRALGPLPAVSLLSSLCFGSCCWGTASRASPPPAHDSFLRYG